MSATRRATVLTAALFTALSIGPAGISQASAASQCTKAPAVAKSAGITERAVPRECRRHRDRARYERGYRDGFRQGYRDGRKDCKKRSSFFHRRLDCYTRGWTDGYVRGYSRACD
ncbi:hypothetical protein GCM10023085_66370 [Actinomadura viridis]|uniref:Flagellar biosynthesis/type III secretory pathway protein FliH n=1 Tax=Actinomadura viridis TaxID=58110 RepID=A0A931GT11_9ACTN|nr:flagellar biosynthesis/type III secretory pathway protein FliH [Actinomadura viridis]